MIHRFPIGLCLLLAIAAAAGAQDLPRLDGAGAKPVQPPPSAAPAPATGWKVATPASAESKPAPGTALPVTPAAPQPPSPADMPAAPATVQFRDGKLSVHAANSSLMQILKDITARTGMTVEGTPEDERVFGNFGPAPVGDVVAQLLDGGSSNYVLFGRAANQSPRTLVITPKASLAPGAALAANGAPPAAVVSNDDDDDEDAPATVAPIRPLVPIQPQPESQAQPAQPPTPPGIRTPQQILEDMQRRRQQQQQQSQ